MAGSRFLSGVMGIPKWRKYRRSTPPSSSAPINGLCGDIIYMVLREAIAPAAATIGQWKDSLALLAVCRRWREAGLPLVYSQIFISLDSPRTTTRGSLRALHLGRWLRPRCSTNADLAVLGNYTHIAKTMHIAARGPISSAEFLQGVAGALKLQTSRWLNVKCAVFEFGSGVLESMNERYVDPKVFAGLFARNIHRLAALDIKILGRHDGPQCDFLSMITDMYAGQLVRFSADADLSLQSARFSSDLAGLRLSMKPLLIQTLPKIDPRQLQHLSLFDVVANFEWNIFARSKTGGQLVFKNLRELSIGYSLDSDMGAAATPPAAQSDKHCGVQLRFPVLKRLHVFRCPRNCILLSKGIYPPKLDKAVIECSPGVGALEKIKDLAPSKELTAILTKVDDGEMDRYYRAMNRLFSSGIISERPSLVLRTKRAVPDPERINWTCLAALNIHTYVTTTVLLGLLEKLPNLDRLDASYLISNHRRGEVCISHGRCNNAEQSEGAPSKLKHVRLRFVLDSKLSDRDTGFVLYLMTRTEALVSLSTTSAMQSRLAKLVAKHVEQHPHLQHINLATTIKQVAV